MSLLSKIGGVLKGAVGGFIGGGIPGAVVGAAGGLAGGGGARLPPPPGAGSVGSWTGGASSRVRRVLPGIGAVAGGAVAGYGMGRMAEGGYAPRRRSRGFSARDVRQAKRLMKMLKDVSAAAPKPRVMRAHSKCD